MVDAADFAGSVTGSNVFTEAIEAKGIAVFLSAALTHMFALSLLRVALGSSSLSERLLSGMFRYFPSSIRQEKTLQETSCTRASRRIPAQNQ